MNPLLEANRLGRRDRQSNAWLLRHVNLTIRAGDRILLRGATGAGKTVLLRALALLDFPDAGDVLLQGASARGADVPAFRRRVIYLHQKPILFPGDVRENLTVPFRLSGWRCRPWNESRVSDWLNELGRSADFLMKFAADLSGGETQIVALLRALQLDPAILLLDEATSALDAKTAAVMENLVTDFASNTPRERAFVWVSHGPVAEEAMFNRIILLREGELEEHS